MGPPEMWDNELIRLIDNAMPPRRIARHAFRPVTS
jgi:hypothetical protein